MPDPHDKPSDSPPPSSTEKLSERETVELSSRIAELSAAKLPLAPGLRAAAAELPNGRLAAAMLRIAAAIDAGRSLELAISAERGCLPAHLTALIEAGIRAGDLGRVLSEFVRLCQTLDDVGRKVRLALVYPAMLILGAAALCFFFFADVIPAMASAVKTFTSGSGFASTQESPSILQTGIDASQWVSLHVATLLIGAAAVAAAIAIAALVAGSRRRRQLAKSLPLVGELWKHSGLVEAAQLLGLLTEKQVPLVESLRLTADGIRDVDLGEAIRDVARRVEAGSSLAHAVEPFSQFPPLWRPILAWGEEHAALPEALATAARISLRRLDQRAELISAVIPPAVFLIVTALFLFMAGEITQLLQVITLLTSGPLPSASAPAAAAVWAGPSLSGPASMLLVGCAILVALRIIYKPRTPAADSLHVVMRLAAWLLLALGILGVLVVFTGAWAWLVWLAALVCWGMAVFRLRESQRLELLELVALSAERPMPLAPAVRAMAEQEGGLFRSRTIPLADDLASGTALQPAIQRNPRSLPRGAALAAKVGEVTGQLAEALRTIDPTRGRPASLGGNPPIRAMSLVYVLSWGGAVATFMGIKIAPAMEYIYKDFRRPLPPLTVFVFHMFRSPWFAVMAAAVLIVASIAGLYAVVRRLGWLRLELPPASWLLAPRESAVALRLLALAVDRGQPMGPLLEYMAKEYPSGLIRKRARFAAAEIARGGEWSASLRRAKLVRRTDAAILKAAERTGDLAWALREAASNGERRLNYRLSLIASVTVPLLILLAGAAVMVFVIGYFLPLVELIGGLARPGAK